MAPGQLTLHADRGAAMTSTPVAFLGAEVGITKTPSRPPVSDDHLDSESQVKTLTYQPEFPDRFGSNRSPSASTARRSNGRTRCAAMLCSAVRSWRR